MKYMPALQKQFTTFYAFASIAIFVYTDREGVSTVHCFKVKEGTRVGCTLGTLFYCSGIHPLNERLDEKYHEFTFCAATDDLTPAVPPPADGDWEATYARIRSYFSDLRMWAKEFGVDIHPTKGGVLLPAGAPLPMHIEGETPLTIRPGLVISGTPVGPATFVRDFIKEKFDAAKDRTLSCMRLKTAHPKLCLDLITANANHALRWITS